MYYSDYLQLDKILNAQELESIKKKEPAHDEMLFIVIHQTYELWFKQVLYEVDSIREILADAEIDDNSPKMQMVVHRLDRVTEILKVLIQQVDIMETMTPLDFLDFRDLLRPASGFQSIQFKVLEASLGLRQEDRHGKQYYKSQLNDRDLKLLLEMEEKPSLVSLINGWLERMPYFEEEYFDKNFWSDYDKVYQTSLGKGEETNKNSFRENFLKNDNTLQFSGKAKMAALFIMMYRGYPMLHLPFRLLNLLLDIDEALATWRYRHMNMVHRMIGSRVGTGGSTGKQYLKGATDRHYIFSELADLNSFLVERKKLPELPHELEKALGFRTL